jgi:hypothetical protein
VPQLYSQIYVYILCLCKTCVTFDNEQPPFFKHKTPIYVLPLVTIFSGEMQKWETFIIHLCTYIYHFHYIDLTYFCLQTFKILFYVWYRHELYFAYFILRIIKRIIFILGSNLFIIVKILGNSTKTNYNSSSTNEIFSFKFFLDSLFPKEIARMCQYAYNCV